MDIAVEICKNLKFFPNSKNRIWGFFNYYLFLSAPDSIVLVAGCFWKDRLNFAGDWRPLHHWVLQHSRQQQSWLTWLTPNGTVSVLVPVSQSVSSFMPNLCGEIVTYDKCNDKYLQIGADIHWRLGWGHQIRPLWHVIDLLLHRSYGAKTFIFL